MRRKKVSEHVPEEWIICPACKRYYGFVRCRISLGYPKRERCLDCAIEEKKSGVILEEK